jgi:hypothetical protein
MGARPLPDKQAGPDTTPAPPLQMPRPSSTTGSLPDGADPRRIGELLNEWLSIQMDTVDALTADAAAKVAEIPDLHQLWFLLGELTVRLHCVELEVADLKRGRR